MDRLYRLGILKYLRLGRLFVVGDTVYVSPTPHLVGEQHELGSFSNFVKSYARQAARFPDLTGESPVVERARRVTAQHYAIRFCLNDLFNTLKSRQSLNEQDEFLHERARLFSSLASHIRAFRRNSPSNIVETNIADEFRKHFLPPCAIDAESIAPLKEVPAMSSKEECFRIGDQYFRLNNKRSQPLNEAIEAIKTRALANGQAAGPKLTRTTELAKTVLADLSQLFSTYSGSDHGTYRVIHTDPCHELQHNARGDFVLVQGPVQHRLAAGKLCIGLAIQGKSRQQMLHVSPTTAPNREKFWTEEGLPQTNAICMGRPMQYRHLNSQQYTDAEAVIQWLDAGVIVATARPEYHLVHRGESHRSRWERRMRMLQGGRRSAE